ncbi:MAG: hypothetical protein Q9163_005047 [Psora crenata]
MVPPARKRPGPRKSKPHRVNGVEVPYDPELEVDKDKPKPTPLFPDYSPTPPRPLTEAEKRQTSHFRRLRDSIHHGPLYTVLGENSARVNKAGPLSAKASFNAFEGMPKYSQRYTRKKRAIPKLDTRPYGMLYRFVNGLLLEFFPRELWSTLDPKATVTNGVVESSTKGKRLQMPGYENIEDSVVDEDMPDDDDVAPKLTRKTGGPEDEDDGDQGLEGDDVDDEFDDEEDAGDYNAEQYFDDGGDDGGEDYDAGGDGSGYFE